MTAQQAINQLSKLPPDEQLIISWWQRDFFTEIYSSDITLSEWSEVVSECTHLNWRPISNSIESILDSIHNEEDN